MARKKKQSLDEIVSAQLKKHRGGRGVVIGRENPGAQTGRSRAVGYASKIHGNREIVAQKADKMRKESKRRRLSKSRTAADAARFEEVEANMEKTSRTARSRNKFTKDRALKAADRMRRSGQLKSADGTVRVYGKPYGWPNEPNKRRRSR